jgi:S-DNA-T family DNA segregation ATPase FtsK/SpoIIIE
MERAPQSRPTAALREPNVSENDFAKKTTEQSRTVIQKYIFPPLSLLSPGVQKSGNSSKELRDTAVRLQQILATFGVNVTVTDVSQGPSVTRYELSPEQGVKVSKIVSLTDDIKLNLAATDIRMEAPIPGKAAIGIEVPNKENMTVALRDLLTGKEFKDFPSNLAFAVGKDIGGNVVVSDIAKMPHMLIAGATGSGKSVCINTLIMSLLYKAHPEDVKLIMIDPKVVELSVYNGIPHLLIPVVTDPKKAAAALHWGVSEMTERYQKFADYNVRDLKGFNKKMESLRSEGKEAVPAKLPQIVIIVDELADLMMVAPGEVEESICRLAQLARAAGIHLIIATQRPSVDVITGLIKANMPSRAAFTVSSGVDSRTILDMNGAEKLLGKGDMLFYPQGYSKPARIQGAFVSDKEVQDVVDFLNHQAIGNQYVQEVEERIQNVGNMSGESGEPDNERDEYFEEAGRFLIDKDKASIGMLQRVLKIGFNRASRIMDQLCQYGVVGEEEGTKPRKVQMTREQFEEMLEGEKK